MSGANRCGVSSDVVRFSRAFCSPDATVFLLAFPNTENKEFIEENNYIQVHRVTSELCANG